MFEKIIDETVKDIKTGMKGKVGELKTGLELKTLSSEEYQIINNLTIPYKDGYSQIDHVIFSKYGIFVIETKNYKGWIFGSENDCKWTQTFEKSKYEFYNPIKQNQTHIKALQSLLQGQFPEVELTFHSIIVFSGEAILKEVNTRTPVIYLNELETEIAHHTDKVMKGKDMWFAFDYLRTSNLKDRDTKKEHIQNIKERYEEKGANNEVNRQKEDNEFHGDFRTKVVITKEEQVCPKCKGTGQLNFLQSAIISMKMIMWGIVGLFSWIFENALLELSGMFAILKYVAILIMILSLFKSCPTCGGKKKIVKETKITEKFE